MSPAGGTLMASRDEKPLHQSQKKGIAMGQTLDIVNQFMQSQDPSFLAEDFRFIGPVDQTTGIDAFIKLNEGFFPLVTATMLVLSTKWISRRHRGPR
jgi:hypothetical protein